MVAWEIYAEKRQGKASKAFKWKSTAKAFILLIFSSQICFKRWPHGGEALSGHYYVHPSTITREDQQRLDNNNGASAALEGLHVLLAVL